MSVTVEMLDAAFVEVGDHLSGRRPLDPFSTEANDIRKKRAFATLNRLAKAEDASLHPDVKLIKSGICPSACPGPGHTEPVFCDRDVDPATGEHIDGTKTHRGHVEPGGAPATAWRGSNNDWYWG